MARVLNKIEPANRKKRRQSVDWRCVLFIRNKSYSISRQLSRSTSENGTSVLEAMLEGTRAREIA